MPTDAGAATGRGFLAFLGRELASRPGRLAAVARIAAGCSLVVAIAMLYQIPLPAYMAYAVFLISRDEAASTLLTGIVAALAFTIAVALSLLFYTLDASEPALRLPLMALSTFIGMFLVRTMALGPVAFLAGFVLVLSQTLIDKIPNLEALTRLVLWLWVVVMIPITVTVLMNLLVGENPARLARRAALELLQALASALRHGDAEPLHYHQEKALKLAELRQRAGMLDHSLRPLAAVDGALIEALAELSALQTLLPADTPADACLPLAEACELCAAAYAGGGFVPPLPYPTEALLGSLSAEARPVVIAMAEVLDRLAAGIGRRLAAPGPAASAGSKTLLSPDAFTNPDHARFALKTTIAVMAAYVIYNALDWSGISTSVTTCFFVALGSLGETMHKLTLRLAGASIGGLAGTLCIVYLLPEMTDIGQLCLLIGIAAALCGWVATSSDLLSYAGMQIAFAFFMGVLQDYGPSTDLTVLRDRVAGILLGNVLMSLVFSTLWPTSAVDRARGATAKALRMLAALLAEAGPFKPGSRIAVVRALVDARKYAGLAAFELRMLPAPARRKQAFGYALPLDRLAGAAFTVVDQPPLAGTVGWVQEADGATSGWLAACADQVAAGIATARPPTPPEMPAALPADAPARLRASVEARQFLQSEIEHAVAV